MKEAELLSYATSRLKQSGLVWWRVANQGTSHNGVRKKSHIKGFPDLAGVLPSGRFFAIELKTATGKLSPEQVDWITRLNHTGAIAVVLRTKDQVDSFIAAAKNIKPPQV